MSKKPVVVAIAVLAIGGTVGYGFHLWQEARAVSGSVAWGTVDTREVQLAFETDGRIARLLKEEGESVRAGERLGELDTRSLLIERDRARAQLASLEASLVLAEDGYRDEEIAAALATQKSIESDLALARRTETRQEQLFRAKATSEQNRDDARWARKTLEAKLEAAKADHALLAAGLRPAEIQKARAERDAGEAALRALDYQIAVASVVDSPVDGVVRSRLAEPGDMANANTVVYQISVTDPKWVRVYVSETQLRFVKEGAPAFVTTDTTPPMKATVGFISSQAEFTPKTVQTQDLRTLLVYEVRLNVDDPDNALRLGQPVTVDFATEAQ